MNASSYRLMYFSAHPEDGERLCVGISVCEHGKVFLEYDDRLAKLRCVAGEKHLDFVRGVLENLRNCSREADLLATTSQLEPQFVLSPPRELVVPATESVREQLRKRFLFRWREPRFMKLMEDEIGNRIQDLVAGVAPEAAPRLATGAKPSQILGPDAARRFIIQRPVSRAIIRDRQAVILEGIDTRKGAPSAIIHRAHDIAFNFWQYGNLAQTPGAPSQTKKVLRVGIIFDGHPGRASLREYAHHEISKETDIVIKAEETNELANLRDVLREALADSTLSL